MSTASDLPPHSLNRTSDGKSNDMTSSHALDGIARDDGINVSLSPSQLGSGYTRNDQSDMHRMGKTQELRVGMDGRVTRIDRSRAVADVSSDFNLQFHPRASGDVGGHHNVSRRNARGTLKF